MGYIYEDELKEILPEIMSDWIDKDDESWEWIFQEIEQKCYIGTNKKKGKQWRKYIEDVVGDLKQRVDELSNKVSRLNDICNSHTIRLDRMEPDITATKSIAQIAKQRTEVDYTRCSKEKSDADVIQDVYNRMAGRGATREELDTFRNLIQKYDALEKKEIPVVKKACDTCKYYLSDPNHRPLLRFDILPCNECNGTDKWEAKDNA